MSQKNVLDQNIELCCTSPMTGFYRDGFCNTGDEDKGLHLVCIQASNEFLQFSKSVGNDLSTPMPEAGFAGLNPGDQWCLCAPRWQQAFEANAAPKVLLSSTHMGALEYCQLDDLKKFAVDLN